MKKIRDYILKDQRIYVGLEDSKKTWKVCVRSGKIVVQRTTMEAKYEVLRKLRDLAKSERYKKAVDILRTAPGIGNLTSVRLALEWGDVSRFKRKEEFAGFLGLIPSDYSTADNEHLGHITKQGNRQVRAWLIECAWVAIRHDPVLLEKFNRVAMDAQGTMKYKKRAIVAVARKLALRLRSILLSGESYQVGLIECQAA